jgi:hypothetical protein
MILAKARTKKRAGSDHGVTFEEVRQIMLSLPGVEEGTSYRTPAFRCGGKIMARFHQDGESLVLKIEYAAREVLIGAHPTAFYVTDHYRCWPYVLVRLSNVEVGLLRALIEDVWRSLAPKRAVQAYEARPGA